MALQTKLIFTILAQAMLCILLLSPSAKSVAEDDVYCLESIKESLEDPEALLSSWNFTNTTGRFICNSFMGISCWNDVENRVFSIELRDMHLGGSFPRGLEYCGNLIKLDLSGNKLSGSLPSDVCKRVRHLTTLNLSWNSFSGEIPASIMDCSYLNFLLLNNNKLTGRIPEAIGRMSRLQYFSVADNQLVGAVPPEFGVESYANNTALCGRPLEPCKQKKDKKEENHSSMFMLGFGIGWIVSAVLVSSSLLFFQPPKTVVSKLANYVISVFSKNKKKWQRRS